MRIVPGPAGVEQPTSLGATRSSVVSVDPDPPNGRGSCDAERCSWHVAAGLSRHPGDAGLGPAVPGRTDGLQPHVDVRAGLGTVCRDGDLHLGRPDPGPRALLALEERAWLPRGAGLAQADDRPDGTGPGRRHAGAQD